MNYDNNSCEATEDCSEAKVEAPSLYGYQYSLMIDNGLACLTNDDAIFNITNRLYMLTMKPLDKPYENSRLGKSKFDFHKEGLSKGLCKLRQFGVTCYASSTEIYAKKIHHNFIFRCSDLLILQEHDKVWYNKWKIYCKPVMGTLLQSLEYIFKEAKMRVFLLYKDYNFSKVTNNVIRGTQKSEETFPYLIDLTG